MNESARAGNGSGELAGDIGSNVKEEHSGSGSEETDLIVGELGSSVDDSVIARVCGDLFTCNTVSMGCDKTGESSEVDKREETVGVKSSRVHNTGGPSMSVGRKFGFSEVEIESKELPASGTVGSMFSAVPDDRLVG